MLFRQFNCIALFLSIISSASSTLASESQLVLFDAQLDNDRTNLVLGDELNMAELPLFNATLDYAILPLVLNLLPSTRRNLQKYSAEIAFNNSTLYAQLTKESKKFFDNDHISLEQKKQIFVKHRAQITALAKKQTSFFTSTHYFAPTQEVILLQNIANRLEITRSLFDEEILLRQI